MTDKANIGRCIHDADRHYGVDKGVYFRITGVIDTETYRCQAYSKLTNNPIDSIIKSYHIASIMGRHYVWYRPHILSKKVYIA